MASTNFEDLILRNTRGAQPAAGVAGRLYYVTDESVTERDNGSVWQDVSDAGGGGTTITESAYASPPGSPADGDLWMISNSLLNALRVSSAWSYYFGTLKVSKPVLADFSTWFNEGSTTVDDLGQLLIYTPASAGGNIQGKVKAAPSLNYNIDALIIPGLAYNANYNHCGLCWSDGTKFHVFGFCYDSGWTLESHKFNTATSYSGQYGGNFNYAGNAGIINPVWLRISEDGSNRTCYYSPDLGHHFIQVFQIGRTDFLTATQVGFYLYAANATYAPMMHLLSWQES